MSLRKMMIMIAVVCATCTGVVADTPAELLERGIYQQSTTGDLGKAMSLYAEIINGKKGDDDVLAEATYRLGQCQLSQGNEKGARKTFAQLIKNYPGETAQVLKVLEHLQPPSLVDDSGARTTARAQVRAGGKGRAKIEEKLAKIILPKVSFEDASLTAVLEYLKQRSKDLDVDGEGVNIVLHSSAAELKAGVTLDFDNIPLGEAIRYICQSSGVRYVVEEQAVLIAGSGEQLEELETRFYPVGAGFLDMIRPSDSQNFEPDPKFELGAYFGAFGVESVEGARMVFNAPTARLIATNTVSNLERLERILQELVAQPVQVRFTAEIVEVSDARLRDVDSSLITHAVIKKIPEEMRKTIKRLSGVTLSGNTTIIRDHAGLHHYGFELTPTVSPDEHTIDFELNFEVSERPKPDMSGKPASLWAVATRIMLWDGESAVFQVSKGGAEDAAPVYMIFSGRLVNAGAVPVREPAR